MTTAVPSQDSNQLFLDKRLGEISSVKDFYNFSYKHLVSKAKTVDVVWFNDRRMPDSFFEVEHTTNMQNSLLKFVELQDFYAKFYIAADKMRKGLFERKVKLQAFKTLSRRINFIDYERLSEWHAKAYELTILEENLNI
jgi:hypothetical protein